MRTIIFTIFLMFFVCATACAWHMESDPSNQNATDWKVVLDNGTQFNGTTTDGSIHWNIDNLPAGTYQGQAHFGTPEWELTAENSTEKSGMVWSPGTGFILIRHIMPQAPSKINIQD